MKQILLEEEKMHIRSRHLIITDPFEEISVIPNKLEIVVCKLFQFGGVQNLSFGKKLNDIFSCYILEEFLTFI